MAYAGDVNLLDILLLVLIVAAAAGGLRVGLVARAASWVGLALGVAASTWTVPTALDLVDGGSVTVRLFTGLVVLAVTVTVLTSLFQAFGLRARRSIATGPLSGLDRAAGGLAGGVSVLVLVWFLLPAAAEVPGAVASQVRSSRVVDLVTATAPPSPDTLRTVRGLVDDSRFPEVFSDLDPTPRTGPPPERIPVDEQIVDRVTASTVSIEADGCGRRYEGSGFAAAQDTVVTNAHVVAGADDVAVRRPDGRALEATVVVFDPDRDLAVLEVPGLGQRPLQRAEIEPDQQGAVTGYPGGQDAPRTAPARVEDQRTAVGRDIYGEGPTEREVLFLASSLAQGDSGSPLYDRQGRVAGVVFAISPDRPNTAFAPDVEELDAALDAPRDPGRTGACIS